MLVDPQRLLDPATPPRALWRAFQRREDGAFEAVYRRFAPSVHGYALHRLGDRSAAEDVTQEVMLEAWAKASRFDPTRGEMGAWIMVIARSRVVDHARRARREPTPCADPDAQREADEILELIATWSFEALIEGLDDLDRLLFRLRFQLDLTQERAAEVVNLPLGTVKTRQTRALCRLRSELEACPRRR